jgi:hypothetical protein
MQLSDDVKIQGVISGIMYGQNERVDQLNQRIYDRFQPDKPLQPNLEFRSTSTKYSHFPMVDLRKKAAVDISPPLEYSIDTNFVPPTSRGPIHGYFNNVSTESQLRNQYFAIQKGANQGTYVPSSNSDLYKVSIPYSSSPSIQPYPELFSQSKYQNNRKVQPGVGGDLLFNNTRTQLRGMGR